MNDDVLGHERIQERLVKLERQNRRLKQAGATAIIVAACLFLMGQASRANTAEAQYVTFNENVPPTSGCYKPELYDHGVNISIKVYSISLTAEDLRSSGIQPNVGMFDGMPQMQAAQLAQVVARDLSRLKDIGIVVDNDLPKESNGEIPVHFYASINLAAVRTNSGQVTAYVASAHIAEICSVWDKGKDLGMSVREVEVPGILILPTLNEMVHNLDNLVYDNVMDVVKARRQASLDKNSKIKQTVPEKKP